MYFKNWKIFIYVDKDKAEAFNAVQRESIGGSVLEVLGTIK